MILLYMQNVVLNLYYYVTDKQYTIGFYKDHLSVTNDKE